MDLVASPMSRAARRGGLIEWLGSPAFTHAIHLAPNRHGLSVAILEKFLSRFCLECDRYILNTKHVHLRRSDDRLNMLVMPEKLDTNPHLHGAADFSADFLGGRLNHPWEWKLEQIWRQITGGSGTIRIQADPDRGAAVYATKEAFRRDHDYYHSWFFHRDDKLRNHPNANYLQGVTPKKAALNS